MLSPQSRKTAVEILRIDKHRRTTPSINDKFAVVLRQIDRLKTAILVPYHRQHVAKSERIGETDCCRKPFLRRPHKEMAVILSLVLQMLIPELTDLLFAHRRIVKGILIWP